MDTPAAHPARLDAGLAAADWLLRAAVAVSCCGAAAVALSGYSPINTLLFIHWGAAESTAGFVDHAAAWTLIVLGFAALIRPHPAVVLPVSGWLLAWAAASTVSAGSIYEAVAIPAHATRYIAPFALALLYLGRTGGIEWPLRLAAAATFITHGVEALLLNPTFIDYLIVAGEKLAGLAVTEQQASMMLVAIGIVDIAVGIALVTGRWRSIAAWMALWGLVTAFARIVHGGWGAWPETAIRAANFAVPAAVWCVWQSHAVRSRRAITAPASPAKVLIEEKV